MPNMDGTGPRHAGQPMHGAIGPGRSRRCGHGQGYGAFHGAGRAMAGCRCGFGPCAQAAPDEKAVLEARKETLKRSLDVIEKRLETL
ncbi:MAG: DUF5320 domain-containing protein [Firmicutes bacterium]|nr:DUF5320 domain-containing protein [Bacillota bacterium]